MVDSPRCRFGDGHAPAAVRVTMDAGCVCYPDDREQNLCAQHEYKSEPLGSFEVVEVFGPSLRDRIGDWWELAVGRLSRVPCRFGFHSLSCRGRVDHDPSLGHWTTQW